MNLVLMIPAGLNLDLEVPDHEDEVGVKQPAEDADHGDGVGKAHDGQEDPRPHEADVPLKYKQIAECTRIIGFHVKETTLS